MKLHRYRCSYCSAEVTWTDDWIVNIKGWFHVEITNLYDHHEGKARVEARPPDDYLRLSIIVCPKCAGRRIGNARPRRRPVGYLDRPLNIKLANLLKTIPGEKLCP